MPSQIKSFSKGLKVLKTIIAYNKPITANELCNKLIIDKSTMSRLIVTLINEGIIQYLPQSKDIVLTDILNNDSIAIQRESLIKKTKALLEEIFLHTHECSYIGVFDNYSVLYLNQTDNSNRILKTRNSIGLHAPLHTNALGKTLLAFGHYDVSKIEFKKYTQNTITNLKEFKKHLTSIKNRGFSTDDEEYELGLRCIAVPLFDNENKLVASVGISGSAIRLTPHKLEEFGEKISEIVSKYIVR